MVFSQFINLFKKDKRGIITVVVVGSIIMIFGTALWLIALVPIVTTTNLFPSLGLNMPPQEHSISNMNLVAAGVVEILIIVGPLAWMLISASRRERQGVPY